MAHFSSFPINIYSYRHLYAQYIFILSNNGLVIPGIKTKNQIGELLESLEHVPLSKEIMKKVKEI